MKTNEPTTTEMELEMNNNFVENLRRIGEEEIRSEQDIKRYMVYCLRRWPDGHDLMYMKEWAQRFGMGKEYFRSDEVGQRILDSINEEEISNLQQICQDEDREPTQEELRRYARLSGMSYATLMEMREYNEMEN